MREQKITKNDLKQTALWIYAKSNVVRRFTIDEFVDDSTKLQMSVSHFTWGKTKIDSVKNELHVSTDDGNRVVIDIPTAKILDK